MIAHTSQSRENAPGRRIATAQTSIEDVPPETSPASRSWTKISMQKKLRTADTQLDARGHPTDTWVGPSPEVLAQIGDFAVALAPPNSDSSSRDSIPTRITHRWEGVVTSVEGTEPQDFFEVVLYPTDPSEPVLTAEFNVDAVEEADRKLIVPGAGLVVQVGRYRGGPRRNFSFQAVQMRRLGRWQPEDIEYIRETGAKMLDLFAPDEE